MRERALRSVLLVKALEEADPEGGLLPLAERTNATRAVLREAGRSPETAGEEPTLRHLLPERAERLREKLEPRHPAVGRLANLRWGPLGPGTALILVGLLFGLLLSIFDDTRTVNLLAFPLAGLIVWNLLVYLVLLVLALRRSRARPAPGANGATAERREPSFRGHGLAALYVRLSRPKIGEWLARGAEFDTALVRALQSFTHDWQAWLRPWLVEHARRLLHLAAAAAAIGLIVGFYLRGITLEYRAAWESTFLTPDGVRRALWLMYGPASALSGIPLPRTAADIEALRAGLGGAPAAPWIHLMAITAALYVVVPRLLLATWSRVRAAWWMKRTALPPEVVVYGRHVLRAAGVPVGRLDVEAIAYAHEPAPGAWHGLERLAATALGTDVALQRQEPVRYGEEGAFAATLKESPGPHPERALLVFDVAGTPEDENHGAVLDTVRDAVQRRGANARAAVVLDESSYARRMPPERVAERGDAWERFVAAHGLPVVRADLAALDGEQVEQERLQPPADALRRAFGTAAGTA